MKGDDFGDLTEDELDPLLPEDGPELPGSQGSAQSTAADASPADTSSRNDEEIGEPDHDAEPPTERLSDRTPSRGERPSDAEDGGSHRPSRRPERDRRHGGSARNAPARSAPEPDDEGLDEDSDAFTHEGDDFEQDDPLAPGFDIEEGTPLNSRRGDHELPIRAKVKSPKEFFITEILYRYDILEDDTRAGLSGTYRIELKGFQGGVWTITAGGDQLDVVNRREDAEIVLTLQQRDFLQLVNGQLNPQLAMFAQKMRVQGDMRKAVAFQAILVPGVD